MGTQVHTNGLDGHKLVTPGQVYRKTIEKFTDTMLQQTINAVV
jgi:hypothetical protein